jgi:hypothetical protein
MPNREILDKFLTALVSTLNKAALYQSNHPLFAKTAEDFRQTLLSAFEVSQPFVIGVTLNSLIVENETFVDPGYQELAKKLHLRRVKKIEIRKGITSEELLLFFSKISLPIEEIFKAGGIENVLSKEMTPHLLIHKLDYSELLIRDTSEYKDIWPFLLREAINEKNSEKITKLVDNFGRMLSSFTTAEIFNGVQILESVGNFLDYLRDTDKEKFFRCAREMAQHIFQAKDFSEAELNKTKVLFSSLSEGDFASILSAEIFDIDSFSNINLELFSKVIGEDRVASVCEFTIKKINENFFGNKQKLKARLEDILNQISDPVLNGIYKNAFSSLLKSISLAADISFDRDSLNSNYRLILLHLLLCTTKTESLVVILEEVMLELQNMAKVIDFEYLNMLVGILQKRKETIKSGTFPIFEEIDKFITLSIENSCWDTSSDNLREIADYPRTSVLGVKFYLDRFFSEKKINGIALKLFIKLFPGDLNLFYGQISKSHSDIELLETTIAALKTLDNSLSLPVFEQIYLSSNSYIKIEIIRAMRELDNYRKEFLIDILLKGDIPLKQEVLLILLKDEKTKHEILSAFFAVDDPWKVDSKALIGNIRLMEELALKDAKDYLCELNKKLFFWHWNIKWEIKKLLKKWK